MTTYAVMTANGYLHEMLFEPLRKVVGMSDLDSIDLANLKHDPKKTAPINAMKLCMDWVFDALDDSVDKVPVYVIIHIPLCFITSHSITTGTCVL